MKYWLLVGASLIMLGLVRKGDLLEVIRQSLPQKEAGLMAGIVLGDKIGFDNSFYESLKNSGLIHLVVVSGSNVMLLVGGLIEKMAEWVGRKKSIIWGLMMGWWYVGLVGWEVPVLRAMLLLSTVYYAQLLGRKYSLTRGLILAILIMVLGELKVLTSISFWLSIMAFLGITTFDNFFISNKNFLTVNVVAHVQSSKILLEMTNSLLKTLWVSVWITPILAFVFGKISWVSLVTNLMVLGMVEILTVLGVIGVGVGWVVPILGKMVLWLTLPLLKYLVAIVELGGLVNGANLKFNWWMLIGYYLILLYFLLKNKAKSSFVN